MEILFLQKWDDGKLRDLIQRLKHKNNCKFSIIINFLAATMKLIKEWQALIYSEAQV